MKAMADFDSAPRERWNTGPYERWAEFLVLQMIPDVNTFQVFTAPPGNPAWLRSAIGRVYAIRVIRGKSSLPLCQARQPVGKVLGGLNLLNYKDLQRERDYFATPPRSWK